MRENHTPLTTLETGTPLSELDLLGFSLQYELCATNVLQMLDLSHIPLHSADRRPQDPFVIGGGPGASIYSSGSLFDAFAIGDGEGHPGTSRHTARWKGGLRTSSTSGKRSRACSSLPFTGPAKLSVDALRLTLTTQTFRPDLWSPSARLSTTESVLRSPAVAPEVAAFVRPACCIGR
jgi:hypothetical protein